MRPIPVAHFLPKPPPDSLLDSPAPVVHWSLPGQPQTQSIAPRSLLVEHPRTLVILARHPG